jgi:phospholipid/cholesterol/gamma-HCH transport system substrate-binding protein
VTLLAEKDARFNYLFGKTAVFLLLAVLGIGLVFLWSGLKKGAFTAKSPIYFVADSGQNLSEGMPVKFSGFKIGYLNTLTLDEQGHVQVEVNIETKYLKLIRQDAVMNLKKEGVIGDGVLELSRGSENRSVLEAGGKVKFERTSGLEQAVVDIKDRILPILDDLHLTLHDPNSDVRQALKNLRDFTAELHDTKEKVNLLLDKTDNTIDTVNTSINTLNSAFNKDVPPLLISLRNSAGTAESLSIKLDRELPEMLKKADSSLENLRVTSELIKDTVQRTAPQVPGILLETRETLDKSRKMVDDTKEVVDTLSNHWPLKDIIPPTETGPIRMDSHD